VVAHDLRQGSDCAALAAAGREEHVGDRFVVAQVNHRNRTAAEARRPGEVQGGEVGLKEGSALRGVAARTQGATRSAGLSQADIPDVVGTELPGHTVLLLARTAAAAAAAAARLLALSDPAVDRKEAVAPSIPPVAACSVLASLSVAVQGRRRTRLSP